jgi:SAM-dependent methyltransferase
VDLLDTSPKMLGQAVRRSRTWNVPVSPLEGIVESLPGKGNSYDLIVTCSVLHHVPDLGAFVRAVRSLQTAGGIFIHLQDPNGDFLSDPEYRQRIAEHQPGTMSLMVRRFSPGRIVGRIYRELTGRQGEDYISKTNASLLRQGVIQTSLTVEELFAVTDIHVHDEQGISVNELQRLMPEYELLTRRSYGFFGQLASTLPPSLKRVEEQLIASRVLNGSHVSAVWRLIRQPA